MVAVHDDEIGQGAMLGYDWDAQAYERHSEGQLKWALELLGKIDWTGKESVIDLGCGDGKVTARLAGLVPRGRVLGIDSAPPMISLAVQKYPPSAHPNLAFRQMDVLDLDFLEEFDVAFSNAALHWVKDQRRVLIRVAKALRPGGRILFQMGGAGNARLVLAVLDELILQERWQRWFTGFDFPYGFYHPRDYDAWLLEAGLKPLRNELVPKDMLHNGPEGLAGWVRTTWLPYISRVPQGEREAFIQALCDEYLLRHPPDDGRQVHVPMVRLEVEAIRPA
jgi:trans-aconitate methyltransferase